MGDYVSGKFNTRLSDQPLGFISTEYFWEQVQRMSSEEEVIEFSPITPSATSKQSSGDTSPAANPFDEEAGADRKMPPAERPESLLSRPTEHPRFSTALRHILANILRVDPSSSPIADALKDEGISDTEDLVLLADEDVSSIIVDGRPLKIVYQ